jgi:hypothetical protein
MSVIRTSAITDARRKRAQQRKETLKMETNSQHETGEHSVHRHVRNFPCECEGWCCADVRQIIDGNDHHPNCEQPIDPRHATFGKLVWDMIRKIGGEFCGDEWSEVVLPLAERAGLCNRVTYDPEKHGEEIEAEPGDTIWWWGEDIIPNIGIDGSDTAARQDRK